MVKIDKEKLEQLILNEMSDLESSPFIDTEILISEIKGIQVSIHIVADEDDFRFDDPTGESLLCITEG